MCNRAPRWLKKRGRLVGQVGKGMRMRFSKDRAATAATGNSIVESRFARIMPSDVCACPSSARFSFDVSGTEQKTAAASARGCWRARLLRFILKDEQLRASRLLRNRASGVFCVQSAAGDGAPSPERRSAQYRTEKKPRKRRPLVAPPPAYGNKIVSDHDRLRSESDPDQVEL
jgi:hypothetical protein